MARRQGKFILSGISLKAFPADVKINHIFMRKGNFILSLWKRYLIFFIGILIQSMGIALTVKSALGTPPISSVPYVLSLAYPFTFGQTTFAVNMVFLLGQIALLRRRFNPVQLLQIPAVFVFSCFIDLSMALLGRLHPVFYGEEIFLAILGSALIGLGVAHQVIGRVLMLSGEGIVSAVSQVTGIEFGWVKTGNDCFLVFLTVLFSFLHFGEINGVREGNLIAAVITGSLARFFIRHLSRVDETGHLVYAPHFH